MNETIETILDAKTFAVVGASRSPEKYGYLVYRSLKAAAKTVYPVNPRATIVDGDKCYPTLMDLPEVPEAIVTVVPAEATETAIDECAELGIEYVWMQPGSESDEAIRTAEDAGIHVVSGGPCIMVMLRTHGVNNE